MPRTNYIFVDFENVQEVDLDRIANKPVKVTLVLGLAHKKLEVALVQELLRYAGQIALVETGRSGRNALDLVLSSHIGAARQADPAGYFHIISKDKDFDALIGHLEENGIRAARHASFSDIRVLMNSAEWARNLAEHFKAISNNRPKKRKALETHIQAHFGKALSPGEVGETIRELVAGKIVALSKNDDAGYSG